MNLMVDTGFVPKSTFSPNKKSNSINQAVAKLKDESLKSDQQTMSKNGDLDELNNGNVKKSITNLNHKFDVYSLPSTRLLSDQEKKFCNTIKLRPSQYLNLKTIILKVRIV